MSPRGEIADPQTPDTDAGCGTVKRGDPARGPNSEDAERETLRQRGAEVLAALQVVSWDGFWSEDRLGRLRVRADDERLGHHLEAPARGDAGDLARGVRAVTAGADQGRVRPALDAPQR